MCQTLNIEIIFFDAFEKFTWKWFFFIYFCHKIQHSTNSLILFQYCHFSAIVISPFFVRQSSYIALETSSSVKYSNSDVSIIDLLDHVKNRFIFPQPNVVVWDSHPLKSHTFGILEKRIWSPNFSQPFNGQQSVMQLRYLCWTYVSWNAIEILTCTRLSCCQAILTDYLSNSEQKIRRMCRSTKKPQKQKK